jgi:hypothetical protein
MLGGVGAVESIIEQESLKRDHALDSYRQLVGQSAFDLQTNHALGSLTTAVEAARLSGAFELPDLLEQYRVTDVSLAAQLADACRLSWWEDSCAGVLNAHTALSAMFDRIDVVGREAWSAIDSVLADSLLGACSVRQARDLLDISGLLRFPRIRTLDRAGKAATHQEIDQGQLGARAGEEGAKPSSPVREGTANAYRPVHGRRLWRRLGKRAPFLNAAASHCSAELGTRTSRCWIARTTSTTS